MIATIIPCYNEPRGRLAATVESALEVSDLVVIADDGSREPASHWQADSDARAVIAVRQPNAGPAAAMNLGAYEAIKLGATRLCRLDVGDSFRADAKRRQLALAGPALCSWHFDLVEGKTFTPLPHWQRQIYWDGAFCIDTIVVAVDLWREVGGFDVSLRYGDDWDFAMRVQATCGWEMFPEVTCEAGAFPGGHTKGADVDPVKKQLKHDCLVRCLETGRRLRR